MTLPPDQPSVAGALGDLDPEVFRHYGHQVVDWIVEYLAHPERVPVLARVKPGDVRAALPSAAPEAPGPRSRAALRVGGERRLSLHPQTPPPGHGFPASRS